MSPEQNKSAIAKGRLVGGMSGLIFALIWTALSCWGGDKPGAAVLLVQAVILIASSAWIGGRIAPSLAPPTGKGLACVLGIFGGLAIDALTCILMAMALATEFHHFSTWLQLLEEGITGILWAGFGAIPAIPWGIVTGLCIRASLQPKPHSQHGESLEL